MGCSHAVLSSVKSETASTPTITGAHMKRSAQDAAVSKFGDEERTQDSGTTAEIAAEKLAVPPQLPTLLSHRFPDDLVGKTPGGSQYLFPNTPVSYYTGVNEAPPPDSPVRYYP